VLEIDPKELSFQVSENHSDGCNIGIATQGLTPGARMQVEKEGD
jgi:hypothetical protein